MDIEFMDDDDFVTVGEAAELLGVSRTTIKSMIGNRSIRSNRGSSQPGKKGFRRSMHLIPVSEIRRFLGEDS